MTLVLRYSARSDRGLVRQNNQDAVYAGPRLLALADGMGGHAAGEVASSLVMVDIAHRSEEVGRLRIRDFMLAAPDGFGSLEEVAASLDLQRARGVVAYNPALVVAR